MWMMIWIRGRSMAFWAPIPLWCLGRTLNWLGLPMPWGIGVPGFLSGLLCCFLLVMFWLRTLGAQWVCVTYLLWIMWPKLDGMIGEEWRMEPCCIMWLKFSSCVLSSLGGPLFAWEVRSFFVFVGLSCVEPWFKLVFVVYSCRCGYFRKLAPALHSAQTNAFPMLQRWLSVN